MSEKPSSLDPLSVPICLLTLEERERLRELAVGAWDCPQKQPKRPQRKEDCGSNGTGRKVGQRIYSTNPFIWFYLNLIPLLSNLLTLANIRVLLLYLKATWLNTLFIFLTCGAFLSRSNQGSAHGPTDGMSCRKHSLIVCPLTPNFRANLSFIFESGWPWGTGGLQRFFRSHPRG